MSDPFISVALQFSLFAALGGLLAWYLLCGLSALIWKVADISRRQATMLIAHYRQQATALTRTTTDVGRLPKKVRVAYK